MLEATHGLGLGRIGRHPRRVERGGSLVVVAQPHREHRLVAVMARAQAERAGQRLRCIGGRAALRWPRRSGHRRHRPRCRPDCCATSPAAAPRRASRWCCRTGWPACPAVRSAGPPRGGRHRRRC
ncbi:hypothetical protein G6F66_014334 [Rhizopus arrhizus]|nr:hypothetical protein G6F66_014334 [Rhizopus arrhizus]